MFSLSKQENIKADGKIYVILLKVFTRFYLLLVIILHTGVTLK